MWGNLLLNQKVRLVFVGFLLFVISIIAWFIINSELQKYKDGIVYVSNIRDCSKNIQIKQRDNVFNELYGLVKEVNEYNKKDTLKNYQAKIRDNSCNKLQEINNIVTTSTVIDIPEAKQSWNIIYSWVVEGSTNSEDLGSIIIKCLPEDKLIYGSFNCEKALNFKLYGTDKFDPILPYVPYIGGVYIIRFSPDTKDVSVVFIVDEIYKNNNSIVNIENLKGSIKTWFENRKLNINNYKLSYFIEYKKKATIKN